MDTNIKTIENGYLIEIVDDYDCERKRYYAKDLDTATKYLKEAEKTEQENKQKRKKRE